MANKTGHAADILGRVLSSSELRGQVIERIKEAGVGETLRTGAARLFPNAAPARPAAPKKSSADWSLEAAEAQAALAAQAESAPAALFARAAKALRMTRDLAAAGAVIETGLRLHPTSMVVQREGAELASAESRWADAADLWRLTIGAAGAAASSGAYMRLSAALQKLGRLDDAESVLSDALARHPNDLNLHNEVTDVHWARRAAAAMSAARPSDRSISIAGVCEAMWALEHRLDLLAWRVGDIAPWPLLRMPLYYGVTQRLGLYDPPHPALKSHMGDHDASAAEFEAAWAAREAEHQANRTAGNRVNAFALPQPYAIVMATKKLNGSEPYTDALRLELGDRALLLDFSADGQTMPGALNFHRYKDLFRIRYRKPELARLPREALAMCEAIWEGMFEALGVDIGNLAKTCRQRIVDFDAVAEGFEIFFSVHPIRTLFLTNAYGSTNRAVTHAARLTGARVVELQHGFISQFHLGYSWPGRPDVPYSPDELWSFGSFWPETTPLPKRMDYRVIGAPYVKTLAEAATEPRDDALVIFTSQGVIGRRLFEMALETARKRPDRRVVFRLHPNESLEDYEALRAGAGQIPGNFELSHRTPNIFALLARAGVQVGAFSTTLLEGMALGARTIVLDMPGSEYMSAVLERGDALFVRDVGELIAKLDQAPLCTDPHLYYAKPLARLV